YSSTTDIFFLSLHDALPILTPFILAFFSFYVLRQLFVQIETKLATQFANKTTENLRNKLFSNYFAKPISIRKGTGHLVTLAMEGDRKSTRLNSSHVSISYDV